MEFEIYNCTESDIGLLLNHNPLSKTPGLIMDLAQKSLTDKDVFIKYISDKRLWKLTIDNSPVYIWATSFKGSSLWTEQQKGKSVYLYHFPIYQNILKREYLLEILSWVKTYAIFNKKWYVRIEDTLTLKKHARWYYECDYQLQKSIKTKSNDNKDHWGSESIIHLFELRLKK